MDTSLKQRLIGAVVLIALAVIFLPMLIKGPAPDSGVSDVPLDMPDAPKGDYETRELPLVTPGATPGNGAVGMANTPASQSDTTPAPAGNGIQPAAAGGEYAVTFGAYASSDDADTVIASVRREKLNAYKEAATINGKPAYRVRIGPFPDQASAESARLSAVKIRSDVNAKVIALDAPKPQASSAPAAVPASSPDAATIRTEQLPPEPAKPAPAASTATATAAPKPEAPKPAAPKPAEAKPAAAKPAAAKPEPAPAAAAAADVGFAVQLGAFSKVADANALRDKARGAGFSAFVEQVNTDKGTLSRVKVGPVASRSDAEALKARVAAKLGVNGMVRSHP
ncbi:SPOR domain-containing protein [Pseudoxanthomonas dokdonensis]|uniref:Sporulation protein n=1 Tax=Pseudoxanthomonas dokdonensis TaxID=344882 RepID=A0A0R0CSI1_9GAMM|nr:SPOR domain-containing protein [Pseudoxanthomonas dokdonensis]KRG68179.1 sporulation protein [Pseudoxanthomonas dokdonensis]